MYKQIYFQTRDRAKDQKIPTKQEGNKNVEKYMSKKANADFRKRVSNTV